MAHDITVPGRAEPGDAVAIVSPSFAAPEFFAAVHEQAIQRPADPSVLDGGVLLLEIAHRYHPDAVVCVGPPFGHTRPQWIVPYGGTMTIDGTRRKIWADYR